MDSKLDVILAKLERVGIEQAQLRDAVDGINARLDTLNGKVSRHEDRLNAQAITEAERKGAASVNNRWEERLKPAVWAFIGILAMLILQNSSAVLKAISPK